MAVYERQWRRYEGPTTPLGWRFAVIARYALADAFSSRLFTAFYVLCLLPSAAALLMVYAAHNLPLLEQIGLTKAVLGQLTLPFFKSLFSWQGTLAFLLVVIVSPSLIAADLADDALPLYLARPLARRDYVLGKMTVLFVLLSPPTWIAGLAVFALQSSLEGGGWWLEHVRIGLAYLVGHLAWMLTVSLLSLAVSAWVRYKPAARAVLIGVFFVLGAFAQTVNLVTGSRIGDVVNLGHALAGVVEHLFGTPARHGLPVLANWGTLAATCAVSVWLLSRKLRAHEVVR